MSAATPARRPFAIVPAVITDLQLSQLVQLLRDHQERRDTTLIAPVRDRIGDASFAVDLRVCPIALAEIARCFDHDPAVIAIIDEAQFEQLLVTVSQAYAVPDIVMTLSTRPDASIRVQHAFHSTER